MGPERKYRFPLIIITVRESVVLRQSQLIDMISDTEIDADSMYGKVRAV
jgi:hypothetical protein